ncbi:hypothetical protein LV779_13360 [Streptomyces thinghirensis]|nr:hypothetical protein [Streptomyces thinghirensis]
MAGQTVGHRPGRALAVGLVVRLLFNGADAWPSALVGAALMSVWIVSLVRRRRRHDARDTGAEPDDVPAMERRILQGGPPPEDPRQRQTMAAPVDSVSGGCGATAGGRSRSWLSSSPVRRSHGSSPAPPPQGALTLALAVAFLGWLTWFNLRFDRRLSQMRSRLQG